MICDMDVDFPRGGVVSKRDRQLGQTEKRSNQKRARDENDKDDVAKNKFLKSQYDLVWTRRLSPNVVGADLLALGCVKYCTESDIRLELVDGFIATVPITSISDILLEYLKKLESENMLNTFHLGRLFKVGQLLAMKIVSSKDVEAKKSKKLKKSKDNHRILLATINPKDVNSNLLLTKLQVGQVISASIKSIEDKGFYMDLGSGTFGFLPFNRCSTTTAAEATVGQVLLCTIAECTSVDKRFVQLTSDAYKVLPKISIKEQLLPGSVVKGVVRKVTPRGVYANFGYHMNGFVSRTRLQHRFDKTENFEVNSEITCVVVYLRPNSNVIGFSCQTHLFDSSQNLRVKNLHKIGDKIYGRVKFVSKKNNDVYFAVDDDDNDDNESRDRDNEEDENRTMVYVPANQLQCDNDAEKVGQTYSLGSRHKVRVTQISLFNRLLFATCKKDRLNQKVITLENALPGTLVNGNVDKIDNKFGMFVKIAGGVNLTGFISSLHACDIPVADLHSKFSVGQTVKARVLSVDTERRRLCLTTKKSLVDAKAPVIVSRYDSALKDTEADGTVIQLSAKGVLVLFYNNVKGFLTRKQLETDGIAESPELYFVLGQTIRVRILSIDVTKEKMQLAPSGLSEMEKKFSSTGGSTASSTDVNPTAGTAVNALQKFVTVQLGKIYDGHVLDVTTENEFYVNIYVNKSQRARIHASELKDAFKEGENPLLDMTPDRPVRVKVMGFIKCKDKVRAAECTARRSKILLKSAKKKVLYYKEKYNKGEKVYVFIDRIDGDKCHVQLSPEWKGFIFLEHLSTEPAIRRNAREHFKRGHVFTAYVLSVQRKEKRLVLSLLNANDRAAISKKTKKQIDKDLSTDNHESRDAGRKRKRMNSSLLPPLTDANLIAVSPPPPTNKHPKLDSSGVEMPRLKVEGGFNWTPGRFSMKNLMEVGLKEQKVKIEATDDVVIVQNSSTQMTSDEEEEEESKPNVKFSSKNDDAVSAGKQTRVAKSKFESDKIEEEHLIQKELSLLDPDRKLDAPEDFDRLLMGSPDSSLLWLRYMAMYLQTAEISKARAVADRALKTISLREENERFNVWVAMMNMENLYGTKESLKDVFDRAKSVNDQLKVYRQLLKIYQRSNKILEADELVEEIIRKFKSEFDVWVLVGEHYYSVNPKRPESGRDTMKRAMKSLHETQQIDLVSRYAQMEFRHADAERGRTLFENLLNEYPKRVDVWSVYIDMTIKHRNAEEARVLFERVTSLKLGNHKLKSFYKKWHDFEMRFGTEETKKQISERAAPFMATDKNLVEKE